MIIEKPTIDRKELLAEEAKRLRAITRLLKMTDLLAAHEELGEPIRVDGRIMVPIVRRGGRMRFWRAVNSEVAREL